MTSVRERYVCAWREVRLRSGKDIPRTDKKMEVLALKSHWQRDWPDNSEFVDIDYWDGAYTWQEIYIIQRTVKIGWWHRTRKGRRLP